MGMVEVFVFGGVSHVAEVSLFDSSANVWRAIVDGSLVLFFEWDAGCGFSFGDALLDAWVGEGLSV